MPFAPGFDPKWQDFPDYILGITHEIWEERRIDRLQAYYAPDLIVRSPASIVRGNGGVIAATMATLAEFPDRELPGEDVIWCGDSGLLSSHRLMCWAQHTGDGAYGAASGATLQYRIIADCYCAENQVRDEWLVRDQAAIVVQLGLDPQEWTRAQIAREGGPERCVPPYTPELDLPGPYNGRGNTHAAGQQLETLLIEAMAGDFSVFTKGYDRAVTLHYPRHRTAHGPVEAQAFWMALRSALPSAAFTVHHRMGQDRSGVPRAALRWSLTGTHDGYGAFGAPTGAAMHVMGITHAEFGPRGLRREFTLFDETAVWKQILLATGVV